MTTVPAVNGLWISRAFGVEMEGSFPAPGLPPLTGAAGPGPRTRLEVAAEEEIEAAWGPAGGRRLLEEHSGDCESPARSIDHRPGLGYRLYARHFGLALVSEDGTRVRCAPPADEPWSWQRFLVGRVLPWAAVLRGRELFHASAVGINGQAVALVGASGAGKTSLALHLVLGGARLLTDDVLALDAESGLVRAHPGAGVISVRHAERELIAPELWRRLGAQLGDSEKTYVAVPREEQPRPLAAMYFLRRFAETAGVVELEHPDPRLLLGSSFNQSIQTPARLLGQLDLCARLAATVPLFGLDLPADLGAAGAAALVRAHADGLIAPGDPRR